MSGENTDLKQIFEEGDDLRLNMRHSPHQKDSVREDHNIWLDGIMGVVTGDALGCPVQFMSREEIRGRERGPVTGMEGHGTYDMPAGTWTDDSSMTLALLASIREKKGIDLKDIMDRFGAWLTQGEYTPFGEAFDIGSGTFRSVVRYLMENNVATCGGRKERDNGNGSLMRILPACLYWVDYGREHGISTARVIRSVHEVSGLTHNHIRAKIACGMYFFLVRAVIGGQGVLSERQRDADDVTDGLGALSEGLRDADVMTDGLGSLSECLRKGMRDAFAYYNRDLTLRVELAHYGRLRDLDAFAALPEEEISGSGYVVSSLEAAVWSLLRTDSFRDALLCAVNLGEDTDTVAAIAGGLAGLYYGYDAIPGDWLEVIQRREWIEGMCAI